MSTEPNADGGSAQGRPRPQDTIARDNQVHQILTEKGALTRKQLADELGVTPSLAYMSLFRLRKTGRVERVSGSGGDETQSHTWKAVASEQAPTV
jgi:predicted transcriptional regulator